MSTKLIRTTMAAAMVFGLAGTALASNFRSAASGAWNLKTNWQVETTPGTWVTPSVPPGASDAVLVRASFPITVGSSAACAQLTIEASATLTIGGASAGTLAVSGSSTFSGTLAVGANGIFDIAGTSTFSGSPSVSVASTGIFKVNGTSMTIAGSSFTVASGGELALLGASPSVILTGAGLALNGKMSLTSSSGNPVFDVQYSHTVPASSTGEIVGDVSAAAVPQINVNATAAGANVQLTSEGKMHGRLTILGAPNVGSGYTAVFVNQDIVDADAGAEVKIDATLSSFDDDNTAKWRVSGGSSAILTFDKASTGLDGLFEMYPSGGNGGRLNINQNITTAGTLEYRQGRIDVPSSTTFVYNGGLVTNGSTCATQPGATSIAGPTTFNPCP